MQERNPLRTTAEVKDVRAEELAKKLNKMLEDANSLSTLEKYEELELLEKILISCKKQKHLTLEDYTRLASRYKEMAGVGIRDRTLDSSDKEDADARGIKAVPGTKRLKDLATRQYKADQAGIPISLHKEMEDVKKSIDEHKRHQREGRISRADKFSQNLEDLRNRFAQEFEFDVQYLIYTCDRKSYKESLNQAAEKYLLESSLLKVTGGDFNFCSQVKALCHFATIDIQNIETSRISLNLVIEALGTMTMVSYTNDLIEKISSFIKNEKRDEIRFMLETYKRALEIFSRSPDYEKRCEYISQASINSRSSSSNVAQTLSASSLLGQNRSIFFTSSSSQQSSSSSSSSSSQPLQPNVSSSSSSVAALREEERDSKHDSKRARGASESCQDEVPRYARKDDPDDESRKHEKRPPPQQSSSVSSVSSSSTQRSTTTPRH